MDSPDAARITSSLVSAAHTLGTFRLAARLEVREARLALRAPAISGICSSAMASSEYPQSFYKLATLKFETLGTPLFALSNMQQPQQKPCRHYKMGNDSAEGPNPGLITPYI